MNTRRTDIGTQHAFGFNGILQGYDLSARVYAVIQAVEGAFASAMLLIRTWQKRSNGRKELAGMSWHMMQDIGVDHAEVQAELRKPFWKA